MRRMLVVALALGVLLGGIVPVGAEAAWRTIGEASVTGRNAQAVLSTQVAEPEALRVGVDHSLGADVAVDWEVACLRNGRVHELSGSLTLTPPARRALDIPVAVTGCEVSVSVERAERGGGTLQVRLQAR